MTEEIVVISSSSYRVLVEPAYEIWVFVGEKELNPEDDNVDVEVRFPDGRRFAATVFSLRNLDALMLRWSKSGECGFGKYFWAARPIIVRKLTVEVIRELVEYLYRDGDLFQAFERLSGAT